MKINIIYDSKYGNGSKVAEDLMETIKENGLEGHMYSLKDTKPDEIGHADFYIFSSPTHIGGPSRQMKKMIKKGNLPEDGNYGLITTSKKDGSKAADKMRKMLDKRGMNEKINNLNLRVKSRKGPLEKGYRDRVDEFFGEITA